MSDGFLREKTGKIIGRFDKEWIRDTTGKLIARYDSSDDRTRTADGKIVGSGDIRLFELGKKSKS